MDAALLVIDMQKSLFEEGPWNGPAVLGVINHLIARARAAGAPVVFLADRRVEPDAGLHQDLAWKPGDPLIEKGFCDSFLGTDLHAVLQERGVKRLIVAGMQSDFCVDTTCRRAASLGYAVQLVGDAHTTFDHEHLTGEQIVRHHNRILRRLLAGDGSVTVVDSAEASF